MGRRLSFCEFDGELISLRPYGYFLEQKSHNDIPFIALDQNPDISKLSQGAELAKAEAWGTSCIICGPTVTWFQTYVIYFKRLMFERLEHKDDYD
ncbi:MAG: hypothetical protein GTO02_22825, partial [Candidatus Dadabacteria bacterium]|nr:hypothetical protein [Candidatus Dadabacteria bacterium]